MIATWLVIAGSLFAAFPPLIVVAERNPPDFMPANSAVIAANQQMKDAFKEADAANLIAVVLVNEDGLSEADEATYRTLVERLRARGVRMPTLHRPGRQRPPLDEPHPFPGEFVPDPR